MSHSARDYGKPDYTPTSDDPLVNAYYREVTPIVAQLTEAKVPGNQIRIATVISKKEEVARKHLRSIVADCIEKGKAIPLAARSWMPELLLALGEHILNMKLAELGKSIEKWDMVPVAPNNELRNEFRQIATLCAKHPETLDGKLQLGVGMWSTARMKTAKGSTSGW